MRRHEQVISTVLTVGAGLCILAVIGVLSLLSPRRRYLKSWVSLAHGLQIMKVLALVGVAILIVGFLLFVFAYLTRRWGRTRVFEGATVIARFAIDPDGQMCFTVGGLEAQMRGFYVQLRLPNGEVEEYGSSYGLWRQLKNGMRGRAVCKGNQLQAFYQK